MKILAVGGGSGGHVTPVVAVLKVLKSTHPEVELRFWCDKKFYSHAEGIIHHFDPTIPVQTIYSGKLRRYHNMALWKQLLHPGIVLPNLRDMLLVGLGGLQSIIKLLMWRPDVVFTKGGFVCLPVGIAAKLLNIPLVIHDSDAHPGLTNRILSRWATSIGTGAPLEYYSYPKAKANYVGIPVADDCALLTPAEQLTAKQSFGVDPQRPLVVITGGGLGARRINQAVLNSLDDLLAVCSVILISGSGQYDELVPLTPVNSDQFQLHPFVTPLTPMLGAADIVIARAGATTLLELAAMAKPTIIIPNGHLTGGHQLKNAAVYSDKHAVIVITEDELDATPNVLVDTVTRLIEHRVEREQLGERIHAFAKPQAAVDMAKMILTAVENK